MIAILWWLVAGLTGASCLYLLLAIAAVASHRQRRGPGWAAPPNVTLLKPLCGAEHGLDEALASFFAQHTDFPVRFIFGVADAADPALETCRAVAARFPACRVDYVVDPAVRGRNPKISNLINMADRGTSEIVIVSDSDIVIAPGTLQALVDALATPGAGAATTLYRARPGIADDPIRSFGAWYLDYWDLPSQMLYARLASPSVTYGPLTAIRHDVLDAIGGLQALADHLCDDAELGRLVRAAGYDIVFTPAIAETLVNDASPGQLFGHELRWMRITRQLVPVGHGASIVTNIGPLSLLLLLGHGWIGHAAIAVPVLLRWVLARLVIHRFGKAGTLPTPSPLSLWARDWACFAVWVTSFFVGHVAWRGRNLRIEPGEPPRHERPLTEQVA